MQTFITDHNLITSAQNLDNKRLGKQRVEALQILDNLLGLSGGWTNHPAVKMWRGHECYLLCRYLPSILNEWELRGFKNKLCRQHEAKLRWSMALPSWAIGVLEPPPWLKDDFIRSHRSNLIRKHPGHYRPLWPDVPPDLPYVWPLGKKGQNHA